MSNRQRKPFWQFRCPDCFESVEMHRKTALKTQPRCWNCGSAMLREGNRQLGKWLLSEEGDDE